VTVPTLIIGGQADTIAPPAQFSIPFFTGMSSNVDKGYLELAGGRRTSPQHSELDDRRSQHRLAEALRRQRHPVRAVPLPGSGGDLGGQPVPGRLPTPGRTGVSGLLVTLALTRIS
jgi:hypothetical protein